MKTRLSITAMLMVLLALNIYAQKHELWGLGPIPGPTDSLLQASNKKSYEMSHAAGANNRKYEVFSASGGDAEGNTGSVSYTVGQIVYTTISGDSAMVAQGIQQPYEITVATAIINTEDILLDAVAYPNPVFNNLKLRMGRRDFGRISWQLFDNYGRLVMAKKVTGPETSIPMQGLSRGTYYLKVIYKGNTAEKGMKTFKIIKK